MVLHVLSVALVALLVAQGLDLAGDRLVMDLAISLAQPVAVARDALLHAVAVLPDLVAVEDLGQAQAVRQDRLDVGVAGRAIREPHHHSGALLGEGKHAHFLAARRQR